MKKVYRFKMATILLIFLPRDCTIPQKFQRNLTQNSISLLYIETHNITFQEALDRANYACLQSFWYIFEKSRFEQLATDSSFDPQVPDTLNYPMNKLKIATCI